MQHPVYNPVHFESSVETLHRDDGRTVSCQIIQTTKEIVMWTYVESDIGTSSEFIPMTENPELYDLYDFDTKRWNEQEVLLYLESILPPWDGILRFYITDKDLIDQVFPRKRSNQEKKS